MRFRVFVGSVAAALLSFGVTPVAAAASAHARIVALDLATGKQLWSAKLPNSQVLGTPVAGPRGVYVASVAPRGGLCSGKAGVLSAFDADRGKQLWRASGETASAADDVIVIAHHGKQVDGLEVLSGKTRWTAPGLIGAERIINGVAIVAGSSPTSLVALDAHTGTKV